MKLNATTVSHTKVKMTITGADILELLKSKYPEHFRTSFKSKVFFSVPGGGDWSSTDIDIDSECPVHIEIVTETTK